MEKLTDFGRKMLAQCPGPQSNGIGERELIVERLHGGSGYADYQHMIQELIEAGYLVRDPGTQRIKRVRMAFLEWLKPEAVAIKATAVYFGVPGQGHPSCFLILTHKNWTGSLEQVTREEPDIEKKHCIECGKPLIQRSE